MNEGAREWSQVQAGWADFGDARRGARFGRMLHRIAEHPAGRVTQVFDKGPERDCAYDWLEGSVQPSAIVAALRQGTLGVASGVERLFVAIDGTSLSLVDRRKAKGLGSVGARKLPTRGIQCVTSLALSEEGVPLGLMGLRAWARGPRSKAQRFVRRREGSTEMQHYRLAIEEVCTAANAGGKRPWIIIDRGADCGLLLEEAAAHDADFTIRVAQLKRNCIVGGRTVPLLDAVKKMPRSGHHFVDVPPTDKGAGRVARLDLRFGKVCLKMPGSTKKRPRQMSLTVVWVREPHPPAGEQPLDWMLFTNRVVEDHAEAVDVLGSYCLRWRIEDFHRTWKRGRCRVEDTQLRGFLPIVRWAVMLAAVAARIERLKHLSRTAPEAPATELLSPTEIDVLRAAKRKNKRRSEIVGDGVPTAQVAVRWIAELGGFAGSARTDPGAVTIGRGLQKLLILVAGYELAIRHMEKRPPK